jgi:hypothetical protein
LSDLEVQFWVWKILLVDFFMPSKTCKFSDFYQESYTQNHSTMTYLLVVTAASTVLNVIINPCVFSFANFSITILLTTAIVTKSKFNEEGRRQQAAGRRLNYREIVTKSACTPVNLGFIGDLKPRLGRAKKLNQDYKLNSQWGVVNRKRHFLHASWYRQLMRATYIFIGTSLVINSLSKPAQAQFFQNAETWMTAQFTGAGEAIPLVFNVLRGLFLLYLGISLVKVIQAARQDEDWANLARTPMIILIAVTMGDILANLIIGGGGA